MLELKGELVFKTVAYHRAADAIGRSPVDLVAGLPRRARRRTIPGVGKAISDKIAELATTGHLAFYDRLRAEVPPSLVELLRIPGVGPKTVRQLHDGARHRDASTTCGGPPRRAGCDGLAGMSARTEALDPRGDRPARRPRSTRMLLDRAEELVDGAHRRRSAARPGVRSIEPAGSFRRRRESIGDLDLLAETDDAGRADRRASPSARRLVDRSSTRAATRPPSGCCAGRRST